MRTLPTVKNMPASKMQQEQEFKKLSTCPLPTNYKNQEEDFFYIGVRRQRTHQAVGNGHIDRARDFIPQSALMVVAADEDEPSNTR